MSWHRLFEFLISQMWPQIMQEDLLNSQWLLRPLYAGGYSDSRCMHVNHPAFHMNS